MNYPKNATLTALLKRNGKDGLRVELLDWLKETDLTVAEAEALLELTIEQIQSASRKQPTTAIFKEPPIDVDISEMIFRRFKPLKEDISDLSNLCYTKDLTRDDLILILSSINLNENIFPQS